MDTGDVSRAVDAAREAVGAAPDTPTVSRVVTRLDERPPYVLVGLGEAATGFVVAVSAEGIVESRAKDPAGSHAWWADVAEELVWAPGSASRSPFYPLRRTVVGGSVVLIDHTGSQVAEQPSGRG